MAKEIREDPETQPFRAWLSDWQSISLLSRYLLKGRSYTERYFIMTLVKPTLCIQKHC
jgi:hypothetical protein